MISLVLPTYNEAANITSLIDVVDGVLQHTEHEIIVVDDDSPDGTWKVAEGLRRTHPALRVLRRVGRKGLSSAVMEGFDMAAGDVLAVMDADGQHDATLILNMLSAIKGGADIAIGSRYVEGGSVGDWVTDRRIISSAGTLLAKRLSHVKVSDPLGGFFAVRAQLYKKVRPLLRPAGFKILLEILAAVPHTSKVTEVPLVFRMRLHGHSKLSLKVHLAFLSQVLRLSFRDMFAGACGACGLAFWIACIVMAAMFIPRAWALHLLYTDKNVRTAAEKEVRVIAEKEGWLLSDIEFLRVGPTSMSIRHHERSRGHRTSQRCTLNYGSPIPSCDASK